MEVIQNSPLHLDSKSYFQKKYKNILFINAMDNHNDNRLFFFKEIIKGIVWIFKKIFSIFKAK